MGFVTGGGDTRDTGLHRSALDIWVFLRAPGLLVADAMMGRMMGQALMSTEGYRKGVLISEQNDFI